MQLVEVSKLKAREDNLSGYYKQIAASIDEFRAQTKNLLASLQKQRDDQVIVVGSFIFIIHIKTVRVYLYFFLYPSEISYLFGYTLRHSSYYCILSDTLCKYF